MLEPVRQYAREKLGASGEVEETWNRHTAFFLTVAEEIESKWQGSEQFTWLD
jgi:predicted ATPase